MERELHAKLTKALEIIRKYDWLLDAYVLDFYVDNHWRKLPEAWRACLEQQPPEKLAELLATARTKSTKVWPLTLLCMRQLLQQLSLNRIPVAEHMLPQSALLEHPKLKQFFWKSVKAKKRHEVQKMAAICRRSCDGTPVDFVVDFGAGLGHLARVMGYGFGIRVCCLEMRKELSEQARLKDLHFESIAAKYLTAEERRTFQRPAHITRTLTADMQPQQLLLLLRKTMNLAHPDFSFGIIGLHPCGDLGAILMRLFLNCPQAKFLNIVGCCYMKLTTWPALKDRGKCGYPLSSYLLALGKQSKLSYEAREISCHACEIYCDRLSAKAYDYLKVHAYRAAAERLLIKHWPHLRHCGLRGVKISEGLSFETYFSKAIDGLDIPSLDPQELRNPMTSDDLMQWKRVVIFYTLRLLLAPLVESVILYDRLLLLLEHNCRVEINAIFDPRLSPRNHITSAVKLS